MMGARKSSSCVVRTLLLFTIGLVTYGLVLSGCASSSRSPQRIWQCVRSRAAPVAAVSSTSLPMQQFGPHSPSRQQPPPPPQTPPSPPTSQTPSRPTTAIPTTAASLLAQHIVGVPSPQRPFECRTDRDCDVLASASSSERLLQGRACCARNNRTCVVREGTTDCDCISTMHACAVRDIQTLWTTFVGRCDDLNVAMATRTSHACCSQQWHEATGWTAFYRVCN